jgi:pimeloyl-ACP methyl ester carboxylesterase
MSWPDAWEGYPDSERELMRLPDEEAAVAWCEARFGTDGSGFLAASGWEFPEPDVRMYEDEKVAALLAVARAEAFRQGVGGYAQDMLIQGRGWPFDPAGIAVPVEVLHGEEDTLLPLGHSLHTAELVRGSTLRVLAGHGHFTIVAELPIVALQLSRVP